MQNSNNLTADIGRWNTKQSQSIKTKMIFNPLFNSINIRFLLFSRLKCSQQTQVIGHHTHSQNRIKRERKIVSLIQSSSRKVEIYVARHRKLKIWWKLEFVARNSFNMPKSRLNINKRGERRTTGGRGGKASKMLKWKTWNNASGKITWNIRDNQKWICLMF